MINKLNDLTNKDWLKFQKSWKIYNPPPRTKDKLLHPATFPEELAREFISFFTKKGQVVFDPMCGTGTTLVEALKLGRNAVGVEWYPEYAQIARERLMDVEKDLEIGYYSIFQDDARNVVQSNFITGAPFDYVLTSPPYWDMLKRKGFEGQQKRREAGLATDYGDDLRDFGNIPDYPTFIAELHALYIQMSQHLNPGAYVTIVVKNIKKGGKIYPLAWDLARYLSSHYTLKDERLWLQDNAKLAPYGMGNAWVSNTHHHYCLNFRWEP